MRLQIGSTTYTCEQLQPVSRSSTDIPGLTELSVTLKLPYGTALPSPPQLMGMVLSEDTDDPWKFFSGWYLGVREIIPDLAGGKTLYVLDTAGILFYVDNGKPLANLAYSGSNTLKGIAQALALEAGRTTAGSAFKYLDIDVVPSDTDPITYNIENSIKSLKAALLQLASNNNFELTVQEAGWLDIEDFFETNGSITLLLFREIGSEQNLAPVPLIVYDPTIPNFCRDFGFQEFKFGFRDIGVNTVETQGRYSEFAKDVDETPQTSYEKVFRFPVNPPVAVTGVDEYQITFQLDPYINEVNQVLVKPEIADPLEVLEFDPAVALTEGQAYFDRKVPSITLSQEDYDALTVVNNCIIKVNYLFIKTRESNSGRVSSLGAATNGAFDKVFDVINDQNISTLAQAQTLTSNRLAVVAAKEWFGSCKRKTTTEDWQPGQKFRLQIPAYSLDKWFTVGPVNSTCNPDGKVRVAGVKRDEVIHSFTFREIPRAALGTLTRGLTGGGLSGLGGNSTGSGNPPAFPTYVDEPFDNGDETTCTINIVITGENYTQNNTLSTYDFTLPVDSAESVTLVHTADIESIKESTNVSFYIDGSIDTTEGNLVITFEGNEIYNRPISSSLLGVNKIISLRAHAGESGQVIATLTLDAQPTTTTSYNLFITTDCCAIDTWAGTGTAGFNSDGLDRLATDLNNPTKIRLDADGNAYIADALNYRLRKIDAGTGLVSTVAGSGGNTTPPTDGQPATDQDLGKIRDFVIVGTNIYLILHDWLQIAKINLSNGNYYLIDDDFDEGDEITGITADSSGNLYYSVGFKSVVYKLVSETTRTVYAGMEDFSGFSGDTGLATDAELNLPNGLAMDSANNLYIASVNGARNVVRKVNASDGIINTICGNGSLSVLGVDAADYRIQDGTNLAFSFDPTTQDLYIKADQIILKIDNSTNIITRFAGITDTVDPGFGGDKGSPLTALFDFDGTFFGGLHVESATEIYVADENNNKIRKISCGDMALASCPDTGTITTNTVNTVINGDYGSIVVNPSPSYSAGADTGETDFTVNTTFELDLTNPAFIGHELSLNLSFQNVTTVTSDNTINTTASIKFNGATYYSIADSDSITGIGTANKLHEEVVDITDFIGQILTIEIESNITVTDPDGTTINSNFSAPITC